ncbi:MAG: transcriptional regulator PpsR [Pseudomonadota bacterium]
MTIERRSSERLSAGALPDPSSVDSLVEHAADISVFVLSNGDVAGISVNPDAPSLGSLDHWVGRPFVDFLTVESQEKFTARVAAMREDTSLVPRPLEINHVDNAAWEFPIRYTLHRTYDGDDLLLLGRDMQPIAEVQQRLVAEQMARERDQQRLRSEQTFYNVALEASDTPLIMVEPERGRVRDVNSAAALILGAKPGGLAGSSLAQAFEGRRREELMDTLRSASTGDKAAGVQLVVRRTGKDVTVSPEHFRAAGELFMLCRITQDDELDEAGSELAQSMSRLFAASSDAIVVTDRKGIVRDANEAFLILADAAQLRDVREVSLSDFFVRGAVDLKLMLDTAVKQGRVRSYATQFTSLVGTRAGVEVSVARLSDQGGDSGFGFIIRTVATGDGVDAGDAPAAAVSDDAMKNVMDLVGTASLKELVSATSDVVEKLCIETAVQLTNNNRVAAAEMLGLSRQSLYVKLRKHGLINSNNDD